jgi:hypothetical protein
MTRTNHYRGWAALLAALLLLIVLGCGGDEERQNASGRSGERSTGGAPGSNAKYDLVCESSWSFLEHGTEGREAQKTPGDRCHC